MPTPLFMKDSCGTIWHIARGWIRLFVPSECNSMTEVWTHSLQCYSPAR